MEKDILPIGVFDIGPNHDLISPWVTGGINEEQNVFSNVFFEVFQSNQENDRKVRCVRRPGISTTVTAAGGSDGLGLGCFSAQPYNETNIYFAKRSPSGYSEVWHYNGTNVTLLTNTDGSDPEPTYDRINFVNIGLPNDLYTCAFSIGFNLYLARGRERVTRINVRGGRDLTRPVYLNNRVFVGDRYAGDIIQSKLGDYANWTSEETTTGYIAVESYGGNLVDLARYNNYIVAFKEYSTEFFEDVANQNGSVLGRVPQAIQQVGCVHPNTIVDTGAGELIWVAQDESGNRSVRRLTNSFQCEPIEDLLVARHLNLCQSYNGSYAFLLNANGHQFYVLTLKQDYDQVYDTADIVNSTFVYDLQNKLWTHWRSQGNGGSSFIIGSYTYDPLGRWEVSGACRDLFNTTYTQDYNTGALHQCDDVFTMDKTETIPVKIRISKLTFGTQNRKFINRIHITTDKTASADPPPAADTPLLVLKLERLLNSASAGPTVGRYFWNTPYVGYAFGSGREFAISLESYNGDAFNTITGISVDYDIGEGRGIS